MCHKFEFYNLHTGAHTQGIEGTWKHVKQDYLKHGGLKATDLEVFLAGWCFRHNFCPRSLPKTHFQTICQAIGQHWQQANAFYKKHE